MKEMAPTNAYTTRRNVQCKRSSSPQLVQSKKSSSMELEDLSSSQNMVPVLSSSSCRRITRNQYKRNLLQSKKLLPRSSSSTSMELLPCNSSTLSKTGKGKDKDKIADVSISSTSEVCLTPKGQKHRIPKIVSCPPAPMKKAARRLVTNCSSLQRSPISFFTNPDIEVFFFFALHDISV
ncbi:hypothetical protein MKW94_009613 [Papaver nudicaule]|uniref:Uncharacterized protein n=1 Tax=Papaver nudicaule TaxID=74823 RepID=A0AA41VTT1_PAPNU|nr:hypothetical protein [Papaver nudicaule]